jgi:hypothetical protein
VAVAEKLSRLRTEDYFRERGRKWVVATAKAAAEMRWAR